MVKSLERQENRPDAGIFLTGKTNLLSEDGELHYVPDFFAEQPTQECFQRLQAELAWAGETLQMFGKSVQVPRLVCWYGDPDAAYRYSGVLHQPLEWAPILLELRQQVEDWSGHRFNAVLGNFYRDGRDSMGWHADREAELGTNPCIASLSFGAERRFCLRHRRHSKNLQLILSSGSLLWMGGSIQHHWRHCVPKMPEEAGARINLSFRNILPSPPLA